jgi:hypothetical protein
VIRKIIAVLILTGALAFQTPAADIYIHVGPPHAVKERRGHPPGRDHVWIAGYYLWDGNRHVWVPGRWELPPRPHARWEPHRWVHRHEGWVFVEGHWR